MKRKLAENFRKVRRRIEVACERSRRDPADVTLVAVTKSVGLDVIRMLVDSEVGHLGESHVQALSKRAAMTKEYLARRWRDPATSPSAPVWHMVGHLQRNKVKPLLPWVGVIHSVDSLRLAEQIDNDAAKFGRPIEVLLEVNAGLEPQKHGVPVGAAIHLAEQLESLSQLRLTGLMTMAPLGAGPDQLRRCFRRIGELFEEMRQATIGGEDFRKLSMGMSGDFEIAIECGATIVRIGTALFDGVPGSENV